MDSFDRYSAAIELASVELGNEHRRIDRSLRLYELHKFEQKTARDSLSGTNNKRRGLVLVGGSLLCFSSPALIVRPISPWQMWFLLRAG
jgi:hypothetical protein